MQHDEIARKARELRGDVEALAPLYSSQSMRLRVCLLDLESEAAAMARQIREAG